MKISLFVLLALLSSVIYAEKIQVVTETLHPYNYEENGEIKGASTEIVRAVLARAKRDYAITLLPWSRAYDEAQNVPNVLIYTIMRLPPRESLFKWIRPLGPPEKTILFRLKSNKTVTPTTLEEARKYTIGTYQNGMNEIILENLNFPMINVAPGIKENIAMFFGKRVDMIAFLASALEQHAKMAGHSMDEIEPVLPLYSTTPYMAMSKQTDDAVVRQLQKAYDKLLKEKAITLITH